MNTNSAAGGNDVAELRDSSGDDTFVAKPDVSYISGSSFFNVARGFNVVQAYATAGGNDTAKMFDNDGNDRMIAKKGYAYMYGTGYVNVARGFEKIEGWSLGRGTDRLDQFRGLDCAFSKFGDWDVHSG